MGRRRAAGRRHGPPPPLPTQRHVETGPDGYDYEVRQVPGARATKIYRCPGCDHEVRVGTAHVVVWRTGIGEAAGEDGAEPATGEGAVARPGIFHIKCEIVARTFKLKG